MKRYGRFLKWWAMLSKRLLKMPTYLAVLVLIPCIVLGYAGFADGDSGAITVALAASDMEDAFAQDVFTQLQNSSRLIRFLRCENTTQAREYVRTGKADAAWLFDGSLKTALQKFAVTGQHKPFIHIVEREQSTPLLMARERLTSTMIEICSQDYYIAYLRENAPELDNVSTQMLLDYYHQVVPEGQLFDFSRNTGGAQSEENAYLMSPVRGLVGVMVVLCAMSTAMYYRKDEDNGTFSWISVRHRPWIALGYQMISVIPVVLVSGICLGLSGVSGAFLTELCLGILYSLCCSLTGMVVGQVLKKQSRISVAIALICVVMTAVCPVFYDLGELHTAQLLFLPTYYINAPYAPKYFWGMLPYLAVLLLLYLIIYAVENKRK